jgi:hypothetical protein
MLTNLHRVWRENPTTVIALIMIPTGISAVILGDGVSKAFSNLGGATLIRCMGVAMLAGAALIITSITRDDALQEVLGLSLCALGAAIYGLGVILGLGTQGVVAGLGYLSITLAMLGRIWHLANVATDTTPPDGQ